MLMFSPWPLELAAAVVVVAFADVFAVLGVSVLELELKVDAAAAGTARLADAGDGTDRRRPSCSRGARVPHDD